MPFTSTEIWTAAGAFSAAIGSIGAVWLSVNKSIRYDKKLDKYALDAEKKMAEHKEEIKEFKKSITVVVDSNVEANKTLENKLGDSLKTHSENIKKLDLSVRSHKAETEEIITSHRDKIYDDFMTRIEVEQKLLRIEEGHEIRHKANIGIIEGIKGQLEKIESIISRDAQNKTDKLQSDKDKAESLLEIAQKELTEIRMASRR